MVSRVFLRVTAIWIAWLITGSAVAQSPEIPVYVSDLPEIGFVDTDNNGPGFGDPNFNMFYDRVNDCFYVTGNGVEPFSGNAFTFRAMSESSLQETTSCGAMTNPHPASDFYAATFSQVPGIAPPGTPRSGQMFDSDEDGVLDSVSATLANGTPIVADANMIFDNPSSPQYLRFPNAGFRLVAGGPSARHNVFVPLDGDQLTVVLQTGTQLAVLDLNEGLRIGNSGPFNAVTITGGPSANPGPNPNPNPSENSPFGIPALGPYGIILLMLALLAGFVFSVRRLNSPK